MSGEALMDVRIYTDGSSRMKHGNVGGWAALLVYEHPQHGEITKLVSGGSAATTNNAMELTAVIEGLAQLKCPCRVTVVSDSKYV